MKEEERLWIMKKWQVKSFLKTFYECTSIFKKKPEWPIEYFISEFVEEWEKDATKMMKDDGITFPEP